MSLKDWSPGPQRVIETDVRKILEARGLPSTKQDCQRWAAAFTRRHAPLWMLGTQLLPLDAQRVGAAFLYTWEHPLKPDLPALTLAQRARQRRVRKHR